MLRDRHRLGRGDALQSALTFDLLDGCALEILQQSRLSEDRRTGDLIEHLLQPCTAYSVASGITSFS